MKKGKSHEDFVELRILYFIWVLGARYYEWGCIGWIDKVQIIEIYQQTKISRKTGLIWVSDRIQESLVGHVSPPAQTCPGSSLSSG
jgi:hypothetical protein